MAYRLPRQAWFSARGWMTSPRATPVVGAGFAAMLSRRTSGISNDCAGRWWELSMAIDEMKPTWDADRLRRDRLERLQSEMQRLDVGALYITGINARYVLNEKVPSVATFVPCEGGITAFIRPRDAYAKKAAARLAEPLWAGDDAWEIEGSERT